MPELAGLDPVPAPATTRVGRRILVAAGELFYERGITAVGVDLLAEHAGTTKRTLYQRFGSKDGLIAAYLQQRAHDWQNALLSALRDPAESPGWGGLGVVFAVAERWAAANPRGCAFVNAWSELGAGESEAVDTVRAEKRWMLELFGRLLGDDALAAQIHLLYEGAQIQASILGDRAAFARAEEASRQLTGASGPDGPN
ncbi:TetR/AcrR family transcriptional regulator [Mycolicibacterium palauense]|uniref:TetR/AcrR family transcriptional regulator n=1 Tax=Mycolicibacterium palauense TaxID=2034511 RepID=UPI000BFEFBFA|nr:TetR/AcrR family transcriptional regulator [Mycolicibacterium palauense]